MPVKRDAPVTSTSSASFDAVCRSRVASGAKGELRGDTQRGTSTDAKLSRQEIAATLINLTQESWGHLQGTGRRRRRRTRQKRTTRQRRKRQGRERRESRVGRPRDGMEGCCRANRRETAKRDRKRRTPKGGRRLAHHTPLLKIPVWWRCTVLPSLPWVVCFLSFFLWAR